MSHLHRHSLAISTELLGSMAPQLGRTQYFFGAVVLILNKIFLSVGFLRLMCDVTGCVNGPVEETREDECEKQMDDGTKNQCCT